MYNGNYKVTSLVYIYKCILYMYVQKRYFPLWPNTTIAVVIFTEHVEVNRDDGCSNECSALAVLYFPLNEECLYTLDKKALRAVDVQPHK